jgi:hypothetical protein
MLSYICLPCIAQPNHHLGWVSAKCLCLSQTDYCTPKIENVLL